MIDPLIQKHEAALEEMRAAGYVVVVIMPCELFGVDPQLVYNELESHATAIIADHT